MTNCGETCAYVARKEDPSNWHGKKPDDWVLDMDQPVGLEQKTWECPHDALDGQEYCAFHTYPDDLPADIDEGELFVKAINESNSSDDEIARRKKEFVGATFGPVNILGATLDAGDDYLIRLDHATFTARICADQTVFKHGLSAQAARFEISDQDISDVSMGGISFSQTEFNGDSYLHFDHATFTGDGGLSFNRAKFIDDGDLSFNGAKFTGDADLRFSFTEFNGDSHLKFNHVEFNGDGDLSFHGARFTGPANLSFHSAKFTGAADLSFGTTEFNSDSYLKFHRLEFNGDGNLDFGYAEFNGAGGLDFGYAEFNGDGDLWFNGVKFTGDTALRFSFTEFNGDSHLKFNHAKFNGAGSLDFSYAKFNGDGDLDFGFAKFTGDGGLFFNGAEFTGDGDLSFPYAEFTGDGNFSFNGAKFTGDGDLSFWNAEFNRFVQFWNTEFSGDGHLSLEHAEISSECSFINTRFKPAKQVTFSRANIKELLTIESKIEEGEIRKVREKFDFSDAVISGELRFRGSGQSTARQLSENENNEQSQFDIVFMEVVDFNGARFKQPADFSSTQFRAEADFSGATFEQLADFSSTQFCAEADFSHAQVKNADFQNAVLVGPENTPSTTFDNADLSGGNFSNANLTGASFERAVLNRAELLGANLTRTKLYGALLGDARFNRETKFWLSPDASDRVSDDSLLPVRVLRGIKAKLRRVSRRDRSEPYCVYDPRYRGANGETNLEKAAEVYGTLETLARQQSQPELASDCFLGRKDIQLKQYRKDRNWLMIARSMVPNVVARYGESPLRVLGTAAVTISVCGLAYYSFGLIEHTGTEEPATLFESFYFSALTFTTLGYGDFNPITTGGQMLAVAETSMGVILLAILVFVFGRRATR